jgi:hypothetical protein
MKRIEEELTIARGAPGNLLFLKQMKMLKHCLSSRPFIESLMTSCPPPPMAWPPHSAFSLSFYQAFYQ